MKQEVNIANELLKLAKSLVAEQPNIANTKGNYENFTGQIDWRGIKGTVKNATFKLMGGAKSINWFDGIWEEGKWIDGNWKDGTWKNGIWEKGIW